MDANKLKEEVKNLIAKAKGLFEAPAPAFTPAGAAAPGAAAAPPAAMPTPTIFKLKDGTDISILIEDPNVSALPDTGDMVTQNGAPAPAGDYVLEDGTTISVDATGAISTVIAPTPATQPEFTQPVAKTLEERIAAIEGKINAPLTMAAIEGAPGLTAEQVQEMYAKFATGTTEDRITNLETMIKALMDCNFGYQIRQGQEAEAIQAYKNSLVPMQTTMETQKTELVAAKGEIVKQEGVIKLLFEAVEKLLDEPTGTPATIPENKKDRFTKMDIKHQRLANIAEALKKNRSQYSEQD